MVASLTVLHVQVREYKLNNRLYSALGMELFSFVPIGGLRIISTHSSYKLIKVAPVVVYI